MLVVRFTIQQGPLQVKPCNGIVKPFQQFRHTQIGIDKAVVSGFRRIRRFDVDKNVVVLITTNAELFIQKRGTEQGFGIAVGRYIVHEEIAQSSGLQLDSSRIQCLTESGQIGTLDFDCIHKEFPGCSIDSRQVGRGHNSAINRHG